MCAAAVIGGAGCGGASADDAQQVVDRALAEPHSYRSGVLDARLAIGGGSNASTSAFSLSLKGPWQSSPKGKVPSFAMGTDLKLGGRDLGVRFTSDGRALWATVGGLSYELPGAVFKAFESAYNGSGGSGNGGATLLSRLGFDPTGWITSPETVGSETVGGAETVHVRADVKVDRLADDLDSILTAANGAAGGLLPVPELSGKVREQLAAAVEQASFDLWAGKDDGAIRRVKVTVRTNRVGAAPPVSIDFDVTLGDLNTPQKIEIPDDAANFSGIAGLVAGALGLGDGGEGSGNSAYSKCVSKAKDATAVAKCTESLIK